MSDAQASPVRELFIEELAEVMGGADCPECKIKDLVLTTLGFCEEGPHTC